MHASFSPRKIYSCVRMPSQELYSNWVMINTRDLLKANCTNETQSPAHSV